MPAIGIYLGTEYSCVGVWHDGRVEIIPNDQGNMTTPSCVAFTPYQKLIGEAAKNQADINPTNTIFDMNRLIGRCFSDPTVQSNRKLWPFNVIEGAGDKPKIVVQYRGEEKQFSPEELSAMILAKMKEIADNFFKYSVHDAVVTVPADFNDSQRRATRDAGRIAGLNVMDIMDEPTAAAVAHGFKWNDVYVRRSVLVFDLSISTCDVSVVVYHEGVYTVKTTAGDTNLGSKDFDHGLLNFFIQKIKREHNKDISDNPWSIIRLRSACELAKRALFFSTSTTVEVASLYEGRDYSSNITRDQFNWINKDLFKRCMRLVTKCLEDARMKETDIRKVVLVGGNTQIPKVQKMLQELFDGKELCKSIDLHSVVAYGAALQSVMLKYCTAPIEALRAEIGNANQERVALQRELSEAQKLTEKLIFERDDAKRLSEASQKHIEQLISERDNAIKQVEKLRWLTKQQAPCRKCVECFIVYSYSELQHVTNNFHDSFKLGEGGFGKVYKGILHGTTIAIKILTEGSSQGAKEFYQEVEVLSKLQHPNLVKLIGACAENHALIYEYLPNGSLEDCLRCKDNTLPLSWQARVRIAFEICDALSFLHCTKPHGVVHGDLKPGNVLLDLNNVSKLSDFGLCRQLNWTTDASQPFCFTVCPKGTFGYIDPEYVRTGKMTPQNDVYSFGIMLLQLVTCKDPGYIRQSVEEEHRKGTLKSLVDASAGPWPFKEAEKMISLGLRCSDTMRINRPDLSTVVWKEMKSMADVASASQSSWAVSLCHR